MKLWLDDERTPPDDTWTWVRTAGEAIMFLAVHNAPCKSVMGVGNAVLKQGTVTHVSFDHDLGICNFCLRMGKTECRADGYSVACYIEERVASNEDYFVPVLEVHSQNPVGIQRLRSVFASIEKRVQQREGK